MLSFLKNIGNKKTQNFEKEINDVYKNLKELYKYDSLSEERKEELKSLIEENGYLPYPYVKAIEELTPAEILYGLEIMAKKRCF